MVRNKVPMIQNLEQIFSYMLCDIYLSIMDHHKINKVEDLVLCIGCCGLDCEILALNNGG